MLGKTTAQAQPASPANDDYQAFCAALSASARGRAFLAEYTRQNRNADTERLLAAIDRLQALVAANTARPVPKSVKQQLQALLDEIGAAQSELEAKILATRAEKLSELIALVGRRIAAILASDDVEPAALDEIARPESTHEAAKAVERLHLAVVPIPEQPELPIPSPIATRLAPIGIVHSDAIMAEVNFVEPPPPGPVVKSAKAVTEVAPEPPSALEGMSSVKPASAPANPLASIMALSEEERLALFT